MLMGDGGHYYNSNCRGGQKAVSGLSAGRRKWFLSGHCACTRQLNETAGRIRVFRNSLNARGTMSDGHYGIWAE